jgi:hypothetical protein
VSEIDRRWIVANVIAAVALAAAGFLDYVARDWLEAGGVKTPFGVTLIYAAVSAVLIAGSCAVYAWFTGAVLRQIAPAFPGRQWLALHLAIGVVTGFGLALIYSAPTGEPDDGSGTGLVEWMWLVFYFVNYCTLFGAASGSLEALVLRRAAEGMRSWIAISALAMVVVALLTSPVLLFYPSDGTFAREAAAEGAVFVGTVAQGFVMLLVLRRLRPRRLTS